MLTEDLRLDELDRVEELQHRARALEAAQLFALAFHDPKKLEGIQRDLERDMQGEPMDDSRKTEAIQRIEDVVSLMDRIERRKRRGTGGA